MSAENTPQWYNSNDRGKYPFATSATLTNGSVFIADNVFADARVFAYGGGYDQHLSKIVKTESTITITFADSSNTSLCSGSFDITAPPDDQIVLYDSKGRAVGVLVTDSVRLQSLLAFAYGTYEFSAEQTLLSPVVITPMPDQGVRSVTADDITVSGEVVLVGGRGITLEKRTNDEGEHVIVLHADGERYYNALLCQDESVVTLPCYLRTINELGPDDGGNFSIIAGPGDEDSDVDHPCIRINGENGRVTISLIGGGG